MPTQSIIIRQYPHKVVQIQSDMEQSKLTRYDVGVWRVKYLERIPNEYKLNIQWEEKKEESKTKYRITGDCNSTRLTL